MRYPMRVSLATLLSLLIVLPSTGVADSRAVSNGAPTFLRRTQHFTVYLAGGSLVRREALDLAARLERTLAIARSALGRPSLHASGSTCCRPKAVPAPFVG